MEFMGKWSLRGRVRSPSFMKSEFCKIVHASTNKHISHSYLGKRGFKHASNSYILIPRQLEHNFPIVYINALGYDHLGSELGVVLSI